MKVICACFHTQQTEMLRRMVMMMMMIMVVMMMAMVMMMMIMMTARSEVGKGVYVCIHRIR